MGLSWQLRKSPLSTFLKRLSFSDFVLIIAIFLNIFTWGVISILRLYSLKDHVFDSGIISLSLEIILYQHNFAYILYMLGFSTDRVIFSPLILIDGISGMLIIQDFCLSLPAYFLYRLSKMKTNDNLTSLLIAISYLLYFPLAGSYFFDYHFQSFFILFFIMGYYFLSKEKYKYSFLFLFLSGSVRFPYMIFPILLIVLSVYQLWIKKKNSQPYNKVLWKYSVTSTCVFIIIVLVSAILVDSSYFIRAQSTLSNNASQISGYFHFNTLSIVTTLESSITEKAITIVLILSPLLFIPLRSKKWLLFTVPFLILILFGNKIYEYPNFNHFQYSVLFAPFIFLALIEGIAIGQSKLKKFVQAEQSEELHKELSKGTRIRRICEPNQPRKEVIGVFIAVILFAVVFQPYSPLNTYTSNPFKMDIFHPNMNEYKSYNEIVNLLPTNNPYVIYQNSLPLVDIRDKGLSCLEAYNLSYKFGTNCSFYLMNGKPTTEVDFAIGMVLESSFYCKNGNMFEIMHNLYSRGDYGIEAYSCGFILLEKNYTGSPKIFSPLTYHYTISSYNSNLGNVSVYYPILIPGSYVISLTLGVPTLNVSSMTVTENGTNVSSNLISCGMISGNDNNYTYKFKLNVLNFERGSLLKISSNYNLDGTSICLYNTS